MNAETNAAFDSIVLGGKLTRAGMASFADVPSPADAQSIHAHFCGASNARCGAESSSHVST
jgi:hypothetical protein